MNPIDPSRKSCRHDTSSAKTRGLISEQFRSDSPGHDLPKGIMSQATTQHTTRVLIAALDVLNRQIEVTGQ